MLRKHSVLLLGHRTSISLEEEFWNALKKIAAKKGVGLAALITQIDASRTGENLSSKIRVFVLEEISTF